MNLKNNKKVFVLKVQLTTAVFLLITGLISGFFIFGPELTQIARALSDNYSKSTGDNLDVADWNNLDDDFVAKSGDTMTGPLTLPGDPSANLQAATKHYVDSQITDIIGNSLKMVCGNTTPGATLWETYAPDPLALRVFKVDTSSAGFTSTPHYIARLMGAYSYTVGNPSVRVPEIDGFRFYIYFFGKDFNGLTPSGEYITPAQANDWQWYVEWCAIGK